jgi:WD40 repeat protein
MLQPLLFLGFLLGLLAANPALADAPAAADAAGRATALPLAALEILRDECVACHRTGKAKGGLKLETLEAIQGGGESGPAIHPTQFSESLLLRVLLKGSDPHMPPKKQLSEEQIATVRGWLQAGAPWDAAVMDKPPRSKPVTLKPMPKSVQPVFAISFSPDGETLAVARGGELELRDAKAAHYPLKWVITAEMETIASVLWLEESQSLATGGFRQIGFWNAADGASKGRLTEGLSGDVTALCVRGGTLWAADSLASRAGFVHRISVPERRILQTWKGHADSVYGLHLSPDGAWLASAGADRLARRWDPFTGVLAATYEGHTNQVLGVVFDPQGPRLATTGADREVKIWDRDSREQDAVLGDKKQVTSAIDWSADGSRLASVTDRGNGSIFSEIKKHTGEQSSASSKVQKLEKVNAVLQCVTTNKDGSRVAAGAADGRIFLWNGADGKLIPLD